MGHRLGVLFHPRFWLRIYPICHAWSDALEIILDAAEMGDIEIVQGERVAKIGKQSVWIGGYPHAYGSQYPGPDKLPRRKTALRLSRVLALAAARRAIEADLIPTSPSPENVGGTS